jgi:hypothetical protein
MPLSEMNVPMATTQGRAAHIRGLELHRCPYPLGTVSALLWISAWVEEDRETEEAVIAICHERGRLGA